MPTRREAAQMEYGTTLGPFYDRIETTPEAFAFVEPTLDREVVAADTDPDPASVGDRIAAQGLDCTVHLPTGVALVSPVPEVRRGVLDFQERALAAAAAMGARRAVAHATTTPRDPAPASLLTETVAELADRAAAHGVELVVENLGHLDRGYAMSDVGERVTATDAALCLDTGHAYLEGGNDALREFAATYGDRVAHLHVHDARDRGDSHVPLGSGQCDPSVVAPAVGPDVTAACEVFATDDDLLLHSTDRFARSVGDSFGAPGDSFDASADS